MIIYMAHPVGHDPERDENLARARRWFRWLLDEYPQDAIAVPWLAYCSALDETPANRERGIRDDLAQLRRCDAIALVGGRLSPGMAAERDVAVINGLKVIDLRHLGAEPPK